jgi:uncharacterized protein (TIGR03000 family)
MLRQLSSFLGTAALATAALSLAGGAARTAPAHGGGHGGYYHGGYYHGYHGGYHPYGYGGFHGVYYGPYYGRGFYPPLGYYRPYYGFYRPYYAYSYGGIGFGAFGYGGYGYSLPFYGDYGTAPYTAAATPPASYPNPAVASAGPENAPPPDNAAHLQLLVPENAQVLFDGEPATQTGRVREFVSPALTPGKVYTYNITVRSTDPAGRPVDDRRPIRVRANDWFSIDFTRPAPVEPPPVPPQGP